MDRDDEVLQSVSKLLRDNNINFWACHGTLLGIIRENRLLPWDRDIDLAVWDYETDRNHVAQIFEDAGFKQEYFFADVDSLHFHRVGKNIDINFFKTAVVLRPLTNRVYNMSFKFFVFIIFI